ncbi:hypothetical protein HMPREF9554_02265 [Treponema phagedenis F0421]|nr:hypothetical protein HMPREF9554_02265 [Treponema phagedenis F0421]
MEFGNGEQFNTGLKVFFTKILQKRHVQSLFSRKNRADEHALLI